MTFFIFISLLILAVNCVYMWKLIKDFRKKPEITIKNRKDVVSVSAFSFFQFFLSFIGVSDFAAGSVFYSRIKHLTVKKIPGTLNASAVVPVSAMALFFVTHVQMDPITLSVAIVMQTAGAFFTPHLVARAGVNVIKKLLMAGLVIAAAKLFINGFQISENMPMGLQGCKLAIFGVLCAFFGVLNNFGIGSFALTAFVAYILGLNPVAVFPIMTCAAAISITLASMRFIKLGMVSNSVAILSSVFGAAGVWFAVRIFGNINIGNLGYAFGAVFAICSLAMLANSWWKWDKQTIDCKSPNIKTSVVSHYIGITAIILVILQFIYDSYMNFSDLDESIILMEMDSSVRETEELTSVKFEKIQTYLESSGKAIFHLIENGATLHKIEDYLYEASLMHKEMFMLHFGSNEDYFGKKFMLVSGEEMRPHAREMKYTERPWYINAQKVSGNNMIYSLHKDYFTGKYIVNISLNVYGRNGKKAGVVGGSFPVENLDKMLNPGTSGKQNLFLIDSGGFFITHSDTNKILNRNFFEDYGLPEHKNSILKNDKHSRIAGNSRVYFSHIPKMNCFLVTVASLENNSDNIHIKGLTTNFISSILIALFFIILVISGFLILLRIEISSHAETKTVSLTDPLTGIANRRAFLDKIHEEWNRLAREKRQMSFFILDADKFKNYNDDYGHLQGDELLKALANEIKNCARRPGDIAARLGGEEFGILLPEISLENAIGIAENLRQKIEQMRVPMLDGSEPVVVTVSIGVASAIPSSENSYETLIKIADKMLYKAKQSGRNMVCGS